MAKKTIILMLFTLCAFSAMAGGGLIQIGLKAGVTTQNVDIIRPDAGIHTLGTDSRAGFQIGVVSRLNLALFHIQPELLYTMNSYKLISAPSGTDPGAKLSTSKVRTSSVELPILVGIKLLFFRINAGPVFNLMTDNTVKSDKELHGVMILKPTISFAAGVGIDLGKVNIDVRYNGQFKRPIQSIKISDQKSFDYKSKFKSWAFSVGYMF